MFNFLKNKDKSNETQTLKVPPKPDKLIIKRFWFLTIIGNDNKTLISLNTKTDVESNMPTDFLDCLKWFSYHKSDGYLLTYNKGFYSIDRQNIQYVNVCYEDQEVADI